MVTTVQDGGNEACQHRTEKDERFFQEEIVVLHDLSTCGANSRIFFVDVQNCSLHVARKEVLEDHKWSRHAVPSFEKSDSVRSPGENPPIPPPPPLELCCMSGCQNCVMIQHAEELMKMYDDDSAARASLEEIPDENLKTFLKMEMNFK